MKLVEDLLDFVDTYPDFIKFIKFFKQLHVKFYFFELIWDVSTKAISFKMIVINYLRATWYYYINSKNLVGLL